MPGCARLTRVRGCPNDQQRRRRRSPRQRARCQPDPGAVAVACPRPQRRPPGQRPSPKARPRKSTMRRRTRTLIGTLAILVFVCLYGPLAMTLADSRISETPAAVQAVIYSILGIAWIFPLMPLIRWMERPDR
ncbi:hypothetical protein ME121_5789 [Methylobacterium sp. ME121]|nr:hypothetical protein ME121_5789 [Methylobacterium sp. ME121]